MKRKKTGYFRVLSITNNPENYPESISDSVEFPDLVEEVEDEQELFIYHQESGQFYPAGDFFRMVNVIDFTATFEEEIER